MPKITMPGSYFNVEKLKDLGEVTYTIKECVFENVAPEEKTPESKWVVYFHETPTGVVLNQSRLEQLVNIFGVNDSESWHDQPATLYVDPNVRMGQKKTGGVAFKAPIIASTAAVKKGPLWPVQGDCYGMTMDEIPSDYLEDWLQKYTNAALNVRRMAKEELLGRG